MIWRKGKGTVPKNIEFYLDKDLLWEKKKKTWLPINDILFDLILFYGSSCFAYMFDSFPFSKLHFLGNLIKRIDMFLLNDEWNPRFTFYLMKNYMFFISVLYK